MNTREKIARAFFEKDKVAYLDGMTALNGGRSRRTWMPKAKATYDSISHQTWERLDKRDWERYYGMADTALEALKGAGESLKDYPGLEYRAGRVVIEGMVNPKDCATIFETMIDAIKEGK